MKQNYYLVRVENRATGEVFETSCWARSPASALSHILRLIKGGYTSAEINSARFCCTVSSELSIDEIYND